MVKKKAREQKQKEIAMEEEKERADEERTLEQKTKAKEDYLARQSKSPVKKGAAKFEDDW